MNKQLLLTVLLLLTVVLSVSAISASEVNVTDSYATNLVDDTSDVSGPVDNAADSSVLSVSSDSNVDNDPSKVSLSSEEVLESENSNTLSTNSGSNSVSSDGQGNAAGSPEDSQDKLQASNATVDVSKTITSKDVTKYYKGSAQYSATFLDKNGNPLTNTNVKITVNKVTYTKKTNAKGVASLAVNLKPGTYKVEAVNPVTGYKLINNFKILSTITANDVTKVYTDGRKFYATFLNSNGKALANKNIKFKINGKTYTKTTNAKGVASLTMYNLKKGTYKMISYNVDGLTKTNTVKVVTYTTSELTTSAYTFLKSDSKTIKVTLHNGLGYAPGAGKIIKFTVNGKTYSAKTNSKGVASLILPSLNAGTYTVKYSFAGNNFYKASSASNKLYILPSKTAKFTVKSTTTFGKGANTPFKVALTSGTVPLVKKTVTLTIKGKSYTKTTDSNGIVSLPIDLAVGKYTISYSFKGDSKVNSKTESSSITVKERAATKLTWKSGTSFYQGAQTYKVLLQDANSKALANKVVKLTVNSKTYSATTASNGYATFNVNVAPGDYTVSFSYSADGDNVNAPSSKTAKISVEKKSTTGYGYWVYGDDMKSVSLKNLASQGATDLFLNYAAISKHGQSAVESWISSANKLGMNVHIWMQAFYQGGSWTNPVKSGSPNTAFFEKKISEAKTYAKIKGVSGIHFDYLRYPGTAYKTTGGTAAISQFVKQATEAIHKINSNLIVSCALMPETTSNAYYYGQDYSAISQYMDVVIPMIYKGNYGKTSTWITTTTKWFVDNSKGAQVWAGLQGYKSDSSVVKLTSSEIKKDSQAALDGNAPGVIIFRYGVTNLVDFNSLSDKSSSPSTTGSISLANIVAAANSLKTTIDSKNSIPTTVSVGGVSYSTAQFLYMMTKAVENIKSGKTSTQILPVASEVPSNPSGSAKSGNLTTSDFVDLAKRVSNYIANNGQAPNYASSSLGNIKYDSLVDAFARILSYYKTNSKLPSYVTIGEDSKTTSAKTISIKNVITGASNLKTYYTNNKKLPSTVTAGGITFTLPEFLYVMSQAICQIGNSNTKDIDVISGVSAPGNPSGDSISSAQLTDDKFLIVAKNVASYITTNKRAPNYASSAVGKIIYSELVDSFSRILAFYGTDNRLPSYVTISTSSSSSSSAVTASGSGLNEKNTISDLTAYLKASTNCQVDNSKIKSLVDKLTKGLTTATQKATAIYNYVRDSISYSFYYDTKYGAVGTLDAKRGNCVDQAHLVVAMFRTADLPARYVHGTCRFSSGSTYGHVWAQVLVDGKWTVADATSSRNSLGKVANWNTNSFTLKSITSSISF
ncbi:pseudomurein-binding repeat-containing protein [uncultured Methanobrevibacter sp.]|uniref:pseudomurein-binding repeat-containing protein n=1 Tax=uncultured Methanobrevibacter sp. TaxID=253161 RepID=UPI0025F2EB34|nr:pseudomurein-binding repeat-containing protein [uncultured Methanobrevibacter sp.]